MLVGAISTSTGSPPRVRELRVFEASKWRKRGITPACAGITPFICPICLGRRDHPRVCGNYYYYITSACKTLGSPPRVRELQLAER